MHCTLLSVRAYSQGLSAVHFSQPVLPQVLENEDILYFSRTLLDRECQDWFLDWSKRSQLIAPDYKLLLLALYFSFLNGDQNQASTETKHLKGFNR